MPAIAKAVASTVKTPGFYQTVNLLGGASNPGTSALRVLLICPPNTSGGDITADTEVRQVFGPDDVATALGSGNPGHLASKRLFEHYGLAKVDVIAPAESAGAAATGTQTFSGTATENSTLRFRVHGRTIDVAWLSGEASTAFVARAVPAINALASDLFATAAANTSDIDYTAKSKGPWGNDVRLNVSVIEGGGGITIAANPATLTSGTTEPTIATALTNVDTTEYGLIVLCVSNADATLATSSSNVDRLKVQIQTLDSGNAAKLQFGIVGHTGAIADVKGGSADRNAAEMEYVYGQTFEDLPCELAGAEAGDTLRFVTLRPNYNRIGNKLNLYGPADVPTSKLTDAEVEDLLESGVTPLSFELGTSEIFVVRPITTHSLNGANPDFRALDVSDVHGIYAVARDLRAAVPIEFANASISEDLPPNADPLPPGVVEIKDVRAFVTSRLGFWVKQGVVNRAALQAAIDADELVFELDAGDETQLNSILPLKIVKPLAKIGNVVQKVA